MKKNKLMIFLCVFLFSLMGYTTKVSSASWDPVKWVFCSMGETGKLALKTARTDYIPYMLASKSATGKADNPNNVYNQLLTFSGYDIGKDTGNAFERFGLSGLNYISYTGEWKYYDIDVCDTGDRQIPRSTNYGIFYEGRLDPLSTYGEIGSTLDIRTKEYARGRWNAFFKALLNNFTNTILMIPKLIVTFALAFMSIAFTDILSMFGFNEAVQGDLMKKLYDTVFTPLLTTAILATAIYMIWYGIIKRQFRTAVINGLAKPILAIAITMLLANNPKAVSIPNNIATFGQSLVVDSLSGTITGDGSSSLCEVQQVKAETDREKEGFLSSNANRMKAIIGCRVWSEFLMKPFIRGQFGKSYKDLEDIGNENSDWVGKPTVDLGSKTVENWGLFHVSVMSGKHHPLDKVNSMLVNGLNKDYYRIVDALSNYNEEVKEDDKDENKGDGYVSYDEGTMTSQIPIPKNTTPTSVWSSWVGNNGGERMSMTLVMIVFSLLGGVLLLVLSVATAVYGVGITLLTLTAPVFMILSAWGGRGNSIFLKYFGTLATLILKKIGYSFLLVLSVLITTNTLNVMDDIGYLNSVLFLIACVYILFKLRKTIVDKYFNLGFDSLDLSSVTNVFDKVKGATKQSGKALVGATAAGVSSSVHGGGFGEGFSKGLIHSARQQMYRNTDTRRMMMSYDKIRGRNPDGTEKGFARCVSCGVPIRQGDTYYTDEDGNMHCDMCASANGYQDMEADIYTEGRKTGGVRSTKENKSIEIDGEQVKILSTKEYANTISGMDKGGFASVKEDLKSRVADSIAVLNYDSDKVIKNGKQADFTIPDLLNGMKLSDGTVLNHETLSKELQKQNNNGVSGKHNVNGTISKGWIEWYKAQAKYHGISDTDIQADVENIRSSVERC